MLLANIDYIPDKKYKILGLVDASVVKAKGPGGDLLASLEAFAGGDVTEYADMLTHARQQAVEKMMNVAETMGADAVINIRYTTCAVMQNAAEIIVYGTAVKFI